MGDVSIERLRGGMAAVLIGAAITVCAPRRAAAQNVVVDWNAFAITAAGAAGQNGLLQERSIAITSVAVSDAVNAITNEYTRYGSRLTPPAGASTTAAAIGAAYRALTQLLPSQTQFLDTMLAQSLAKFGVSPGDPGFAFGEAVADEIVAMRAADGAALAQYPYTPPNAGAPGVWVPTPPALCGGAAARLGIRAAMGAQVGRAIPARRGSRSDEPSLCPGPERGQGNRRAEQRDPDRRADQYREILAGVGRGDLERRAPSSRARTRPRRVGGGS